MLGRLISRGVDCRSIEGFKVGIDDISVNHLQFEDATILFLPDYIDKFRNVLTLQIFELISGLEINLSKSSVSRVNPGSYLFDRFVVLAGCEVKSFSILVYL